MSEPRRVDVFSLKGGVGKTTLSVLLARAQAAVAGRPVLLVDADLTGTCLGDLLEPWSARWPLTENLAHLICGRPEALPEQLARPPVYVYRASKPPGDGQPHRIDSADVAPDLDTGIRFCPSHADSAGGDTPVSRAVLHALMGHEATGGWINHVIDALVTATYKRLGLGGVIVDHGPGMAAVQRAALDGVVRAASARRALFITTRDRVDLAGIQAFEETLDGERQHCVWVINKVPSAQSWRESIPEVWRPTAAWFARDALPVVSSDALAYSYADSRVLTVDDGVQALVEALRQQVFG